MNFAAFRRRLTRLEQRVASQQSSSAAPSYPVADPFEFAQALWPNIVFFDKQCDIIRSVANNDETFVVAGHQLGKDFVAGFLAVWFLMAHHPVRIITTSVKREHLRVLWGEINRFIETSRVPLTTKDGGPLLVNRQHVRKVVNGTICPISYLLGYVSATGEGMAGHHAPHTLAIVDEASGADDEAYSRIQTWAKRKLVFGNPYPCNNFFRKAVEEGDVLATSPSSDGQGTSATTGSSDLVSHQPQQSSLV